MRRILALIVPVAFLVGACSGSSPSGPSPTPVPSFPAGSTGTTISGSIGGATTGGGTASTSGLRPDAGPASIVVTIAGTTISTTVDASGKFTLTNVPGGTLTLEFSGPGISGTITIPNVTAGQTIELTLQLTGSSLSLEAERRSSGNEEQVEGRVESLPPTTAPGSLVVAGRTVMTDINTRVLMGSQTLAFADLAIGQRVHVKGQTSGGSLLASLIDIQNTNTSLPVNVNGVIGSLGATFGPTAFTFFVGGREVRGDGATEFFGGSAFADLIVGARVEVKGQQGDGFVQALRIHVNGSDDDDDDDATEAEFTGTLTSIGGTAPALTLAIGGTTVTTTGATEVRRRGDNLDFTVLQIGQTIEVSGTVQAGGTVLAKKLTIESEDDDVDVEGAVVGPISGPCPALTFTIGSITFSTTSSTEFKKTSCAAVLALGATSPTLKVRGVMITAATAQATRVEIAK